MKKPVEVIKDINWIDGAIAFPALSVIVYSILTQI